MTDDENMRANERSGVRPSAQAIARQDRLRDALRENLKRRKSQARGRAGQAAEDQDSGTAPAPHPCARQIDPDQE